MPPGRPSRTLPLCRRRLRPPEARSASCPAAAAATARISRAAQRAFASVRRIRKISLVMPPVCLTAAPSTENGSNSTRRYCASMPSTPTNPTSTARVCAVPCPRRAARRGRSRCRPAARSGYGRVSPRRSVGVGEDDYLSAAGKGGVSARAFRPMKKPPNPWSADYCLDEGSELDFIVFAFDDDRVRYF